MRENRLVENQKRFKRANERLQGAVQDSVCGDQRVPFLCECADGDCLADVRLTLGEFETVRGFESRFIILPRHALTEGEEVVEEHRDYHVTQK